MNRFNLDRKHTGLLVIDVQDKLVPKIENFPEVLFKLTQAINGFQILELPIVVTEQYPQGLGGTVGIIKDLLGTNKPLCAKTAFSCMKDEGAKQEILKMKVNDWVLVGIEAHVCVLQTAKDLLEAGKRVIVLNDAIGSRSIYDFSSAIAELRDCGARISTTETILFELIGDSKDPKFKAISNLVQQCPCGTESSCCRQ